MAIYFLARQGMKPGDFQSYVDVSGLAFVSGQTYPRLGDSLLVCEADTGQMRRLVLASPDYTQVTSDDALVNDCNRSIAAGPGGAVYYSNDQEIRRLVADQSSDRPTSSRSTPASTSPSPSPAELRLAQHEFGKARLANTS